MLGFLDSLWWMVGLLGAGWGRFLGVALSPGLFVRLGCNCGFCCRWRVDII